MYCSKCGKDVTAEGNFCPACGTALGNGADHAEAAAQEPEGFGWFTAVLKKYAVFTGRARRKEYWMFTLFYCIIAVIFSILSSFLSFFGVLFSLFSLAVLLPCWGVAIRRMHDSNHSGWWLLLPIVNLVFLCTEGTGGNNRFGPDPKAE